MLSIPEAARLLYGGGTFWKTRITSMRDWPSPSTPSFQCETGRATPDHAMVSSPRSMHHIADSPPSA